MHIFVDADACPVVGIVEEIAEKYNIPHREYPKVCVNLQTDVR